MYTNISVLIVLLRMLPKVSAKFDIDLPVYHCPNSTDPSQHEKFLNGLNGTRILFIGDSISRYGLFRFFESLSGGTHNPYFHIFLLRVACTHCW